MTDSEAENNLLKIVNQLIFEEHYDGIEIFLQNKRNIPFLKENTADLFELCKLYLTDENFEKKSCLYFACENILKTLANIGIMREVLFELLEFIDSIKSGNAFTSALKALQICLLRKESDKKSLEWGLNEVLSYIKELDFPDCLSLGYDEKQRSLLEQNDKIHKILLNYITVTLFYEPILADNIINSVKFDLYRNTAWDNLNVLSSFLLQLLGRPLALLDLSSKRNSKTNTHSLQCAQKLVTDICTINKNPYFLLEYIEIRCRWGKIFLKQETYDSATKIIFLNAEKFPLSCLCIFYYLLIAEELIPDDAPLIYNSTYLFENCLYLVEYMLREDEPSVHYKAIILCERTLNNLNENKIHLSSLDLKVNANFCEQLSKIVIYSEQNEIRKLGVELFKLFISKFELEAQSVILTKLLEKTQHSGLLGYFMILFKNIVAKELEDKNELKNFCKGKKFQYVLLNLCCKLDNGSQTDLIQNSDAIISALNILRYFAKKDFGNYTGFWNFSREIQIKFLNPLRDGINLSKAHYKAEEYRVLNDIKIEGESELYQKFNINNEPLPTFDKKSKLNILNRSLVTFDLIGSLISRVNDCIEIHRNFVPSASFAFLQHLTKHENYNLKIRHHFCQNQSQQIFPNHNFLFDKSKKKKLSTNFAKSTIDDFRVREEAKDKEFEMANVGKEKFENECTVNNEKLLTVRLKIMEASLSFVEQYGWSVDALTNGAVAAGFPGISHGLFPNGSIDLVLYFYSKCNNKLVEHLKQQTKNGIIIPNEPTDFLVQVIRYRLEMLIKYKKHWPQALANMSLPKNVPKSLAQILTMIDDICYFAGDRSVDFGWYTRRVGISTIYKLTELYMLQDMSENHKATWIFLKNRMDEAKLIESIFGQTGEPNERTKNKLYATFETARNILGLNYDRQI